jgi:hypothetical protein
MYLRLKNVRKTRRGNKVGSITRHWQHWTQDTENKQIKIHPPLLWCGHKTMKERKWTWRNTRHALDVRLVLIRGRGLCIWFTRVGLCIWFTRGGCVFDSSITIKEHPPPPPYKNQTYVECMPRVPSCPLSLFHRFMTTSQQWRIHHCA